MPPHSTPAPGMNAATFSNNNMDYNDGISTAIADLDSQEVPSYGATAKSMTWCAQPCGGGISPSVEVKLQLNLDKSSTGAKRKYSTWSYWPFSSAGYPSNSPNCEKYCREDARRPVRKELGYGIYTPSFISPQMHVVNVIYRYSKHPLIWK